MLNASALTTTRTRIAYLAAFGVSSMGAAWILGLNHGTVRQHCRKLGLHHTRRSPCFAYGLARASRVRYMLALGIPAHALHAITGYSHAYITRCAQAVAPYRAAL